VVRFSLVRRRQVWLPTFAGWLILIAFVVVMALIAGQSIHSFLAPNDPAPAARLLVVEGWMEMKDMDQAIAVFRKGRYERVVTTGGPIETWLELPGSSNSAELAASYLRKHGLEGVDVTAVPSATSARERTFLSAVKLNDWATKQGLAVAALDVFSGGVHARRSRMLYRMAFGPNVDVGILSARPSQYDEERWWQTSVGVKLVLGEAISVAWTACCFYPPPPGSHAEM
jgi:hypothetical protein